MAKEVYIHAHIYFTVLENETEEQAIKRAEETVRGLGHTTDNKEVYVHIQESEVI